MNNILASLPRSTVKALVKRDLSAATKSWGPYVAATVSFLASSLVLKNYLSGVGDNNILIASDPLNFPLYISLVVVSFYLAIISAVSISSEKDRGTLEVLFYGPVNNASYLLSKYMADMTIFLFLIGLLIPYFIFVSLLTNLALSWSLVKGIVLSIFSASCIISFSLLVSAATSKMRNSVIWIIALLGVFLSIQLTNGILLRLDEKALSPLLQYLRMTINVINAGIEWVTPFAPLNKGIQAIVISNAQLYLGSVLFALLYSSFFLIASVVVLHNKGVQA
jgi:ABC-type transport system involved in multi-copper enzyme maturation permease subunit